MLVTQSRHLNVKESSPLATPPSKRAVVKSQQMSPSRSAPRQTGTPTCLSQQKQIQMRPNTSPVRPTVAARKTFASPSPKQVSPTKAPKDRSLADQSLIKATRDALQKSKVHYMANEELQYLYSFDYKVGSGNWACVWRAHNKKNGRVKAIKIVDRHGGNAAQQRSDSLMREFKCLRSIPSNEPWHPSIINFDDLILTSQFLCLVMPYHEKPMQVCVELPTCRNYFEKLASAVGWLHRHYIAHNDLKLVNTVVRSTNEDWDGTPVIVDFGFSTMHHPWRGTNFITTATWGTPEYLSPERVAGRPHDERLSDIWALGVTFFEIATGRTPFERQDETFVTEDGKNEYYRRVAAGEWIIDEFTPWQLEDLCRCMLDLNPAHRARLDEIVQHEFFSPHPMDEPSVSSEVENDRASSTLAQSPGDFGEGFLAKLDDAEEELEDEGLQLSFSSPRRQMQGRATPDDCEQQPFPAGSRNHPRGHHTASRSPNRRKLAAPAVPLPNTPLRSPRKMPSPIKSITSNTGHPANVASPFRPINGSPLRQALQNASSRTNIQGQAQKAGHARMKSQKHENGADEKPQHSPAAMRGATASDTFDRQLTASTLGNHGSQDSSPRQPASSPVVYSGTHLSPVKYVGKQGDAVKRKRSLIALPVRMLSDAGTSRPPVNIDDVSHFDSDTETDSEMDAEVEAPRSQSMHVDSEDETTASRSSSSSSDDTSGSDSASIIELDSPSALTGMAIPTTASDHSGETAPPGYTSAVTQDGSSAHDSISRSASGPALSPVFFSAISTHTEEEPTIRQKIDQDRAPCLNASASPQEPLRELVEAFEASLPPQEQQLTASAAVQTDQMIHDQATQLNVKGLMEKLDSVHLLAFHLLATAQQTRKVLLTYAQTANSTTVHHHAQDIEAQEEALRVMEQSFTAAAERSRRAADNDADISFAAGALPLASTPNNRKRKSLHQVATDQGTPASAASISTSRMGLREEVSCSTFGTPGHKILPDAAADNSIRTALAPSIDDAEILTATRAQDHLEREIAAMHTRSRSIFSVLDDIRSLEVHGDEVRLPVSPAVAEAQESIDDATALNGTLAYASPAASVSTVLLDAGVQQWGNGLQYQPVTEFSSHQEKENMPTTTATPISTCTSPTPSHGASSILQRGMSQLRSSRKRRYPMATTPNSPVQPQSQSHTHSHGRTFSASSLFSTSLLLPTNTQPVTPSSSIVFSGRAGLWKKLRGVGGGATNSRADQVRALGRTV